MAVVSDGSLQEEEEVCMGTMSCPNIGCSMGAVTWPEGAWFEYRSPYGSLVRGEVAKGNRDQRGELCGIESTRGVSYALRMISLEPQAEWKARIRARKISDLGL